jgi:hypothetical protein
LSPSIRLRFNLLRFIPAEEQTTTGVRPAILRFSISRRAPAFLTSDGTHFQFAFFQFTIRNANDPTTFPFAEPAARNAMTTSPPPAQIELHRDRMWRRDEGLRVESAVDAERFIEDVGFVLIDPLIQ